MIKSAKSLHTHIHKIEAVIAIGVIRNAWKNARNKDWTHKYQVQCHTHIHSCTYRPLLFWIQKDRPFPNLLGIFIVLADNRRNSTKWDSKFLSLSQFLSWLPNKKNRSCWNWHADSSHRVCHPFDAKINKWKQRSLQLWCHSNALAVHVISTIIYEPTIYRRSNL